MPSTVLFRWNPGKPCDSHLISKGVYSEADVIDGDGDVNAVAQGFRHSSLSPAA